MGGCYDSFRGEGVSKTGVGEIPVANISISEVAAFVQNERMVVYDDFVVAGRVTSSDREGNFYRSFYIESGGAALEVLEGVLDSYVNHPVGEVVVVKLRGLALACKRGVLQVGLEAEADGDHLLDYLEAQPLIDRYIFCSGKMEEVKPLSVSYEELADDMCGRLITIDSLTFRPVDGSFWTGYQQFVDNSDNSVWCYTSDYASFANLLIPPEPISITGIVQKSKVYLSPAYGEQFIIQMRSLDDCSVY